MVLGMGRSGTSATADILRRLGVYWGPEALMMAPQKDNPRGFWEFTLLYNINVDLLNRLGGDWHRPPILPIGWENSMELDGIRSKAATVIRDHFQVPVWGFKDPRCCLTLPFWKTVISNPIECVIPIRNPLEVAASLAHREGLPIRRSLWLWTAYVVWAWRASRELKRIVISYDRLLANPQAEIRRLEAFLGLERTSSLSAEDGVCVDLRHERIGLEKFLADPDVSGAVKEVYVALQRLANDEPEDVGQLMEKAWNSLFS